MNLLIHNGRPADDSQRLEKEIRTYDLLDSIGIEYERVDHEAAETMEEYLDITPGSVSVFGPFLQAVHHEYTVVRLGMEK